MASAESICQTNCWRTLALRPADHSFIRTLTRPLVPDLLSPLLLCSLSVHISSSYSPHLPFLLVRLVLSCCPRHHSSCSVITRSHRSTHLHSSVVVMDGGIDPTSPGWRSEFTWSRHTSFIHSLALCSTVLSCVLK